MSTLQPTAEPLKNAIKWISERRKATPDINLNKLVDEACFQFDLSPKDSQFLIRFVKDDHHQNPA